MTRCLADCKVPAGAGGGPGGRTTVQEETSVSESSSGAWASASAAGGVSTSGSSSWASGVCCSLEPAWGAACASCGHEASGNGNEVGRAPTLVLWSLTGVTAPFCRLSWSFWSSRWTRESFTLGPTGTPRSLSSAASAACSQQPARAHCLHALSGCTQTWRRPAANVQQPTVTTEARGAPRGHHGRTPAAPHPRRAGASAGRCCPVLGSLSACCRAAVTHMSS